jgi:hypothetical protein
LCNAQGYWQAAFLSRYKADNFEAVSDIAVRTGAGGLSV